MIEYYHDLIDLSNWKTKDQILKELESVGIKENERELRKHIERNNILYSEHMTSKYVVHGSKGYKLTDNTSEILESIMDLKTRAMNELWKYSRTSKAIGENINFDFLEDLINGRA